MDDAEDRRPAAAAAAEFWNDRRRAPVYGGESYGFMIDALRVFLDRLAGSRPPIEEIGELDTSLRRWTEVLAASQVPERDQVFARRPDLPGRGQSMSPVCEMIELDDPMAFAGRVRFGRYFLGGNGAAHGGVVSLLFDEVLGGLANAGGRAVARTAYLHVNYRSITPIDADLIVRAQFVEESGRKRLVRGQLLHGDVVCADAEGLFVELNPGQP